MPEQRAYFLLIDVISAEASDVVVRLHFIIASALTYYGPNRLSFVSLRSLGDESPRQATMLWCAVIAVVNCVTLVILLYVMVDRNPRSTTSKLAQLAASVPKSKRRSKRKRVRAPARTPRV